MNICLLSLEWPPFGCGIATYMFNLARGLRKLGHSVTVITNDRAPVACDGVKISRVSVPSFGGSFWYKIQKWRTEPYYSWSLRAYERFVEICESEKFDIIETAEFGAWARHFVGKLDIPVVVRCHNPTHIVWSINRSSGSSYKKPLWLEFQDSYERTQTICADAIVSPSHALANHLSLSWVIPRSRFSIIANPIDSDLFCPGLVEASQKNEILYIGRLDYNKGVYDLTEAVVPLFKKYPNLRLRLIGQDAKAPNHLRKYGKFASEVIRSLVPVRYQGRIIFTGHIPVSQTVLYQRDAMFTVMPTRGFESFSYTVVEAMSCGCAVVATDCGGPTEIITDGFDGLLVPPGRPGALRDGMERLIKDIDLRNSLSFRARDLIENKYSINVVVPRIVQLYEDVIGQSKDSAKDSEAQLCKI